MKGLLIIIQVYIRSKFPGVTEMFASPKVGHLPVISYHECPKAVNMLPRQPFKTQAAAQPTAQAYDEHAKCACALQDEVGSGAFRPAIHLSRASQAVTRRRN